MKITTGKIAEILQGTIDGDPDVMIHGPSSLEEGLPGTVSFLSNPKYEQFLYSTNASAVLVHEDFSPIMKINPSLIRVKDVGASLSVLFEHFKNKKKSDFHISSEAFIHDGALMGPNISVGLYSVISDGTIIKSGTVIHAQVYVGEDVKIGKNALIYPGVKIYAGTEIGDNCIIHSNAVIGADGFGYTKEGDTYEKIPHLGKVIVENNVEIGANTVLDRGTLGNTIVKEGVKLDNLIQIGHNVEVGKNTVMAAQSGIAGSTKVGDNCVIGGQSGIVGHIKIANGTMIQAQSGVAGSINEENTKLYGTPALAYSNYLKSYAYFKSLPGLANEIRTLQKELDLLKQQLKKRD